MLLKGTKEAAAVIQMREGGRRDQGGSTGNAEKWTVSSRSLTQRLRGLAEGLGRAGEAGEARC